MENNLRKALFFLFLLVALNSDAQERQNLKPYHVGNGKYTLASINGEQRINQIFDEVRNYMYYDKDDTHFSYYAVRKDSLWGLFSTFGDELLTANYQGVGPGLSNQFIVKQNSKFGIVSFNDVPVLPCQFDWITIQGPNAYCIKLNDKFGLIDTAANQLLPPVYNEIEVASNGPGIQRDDCYEYGSNYDHVRCYGYSDHLYYYKTDSSQGVYDSKRQKFITTGNNYCDILWIIGDNISSDANYLFFEDDNRWIVLNSDGETIITINQNNNSEPIFNSLSFDSTGLNNIQHMYFKEDSGSFICDLKSGKRSKTFQQVYSFFGKIIFIDNGEWGILDSDFNEIARVKKYLPTVENSYTSRPIRHCIGDSHYPVLNHYNLDWHDNLIFICERVDSFDYQIIYKLGIMDYVTGAVVKPKYDNIILHKVANASVFMAITLDPEDHNSYSPKSFDFYSYNLVKLSSIGFESVLKLTGSEDGNHIYILRKENGKIGAVNLLGKIVIPFIYDCYAEFYPNLFILGNNGKNGLFNAKGEVLIPVKYERIEWTKNSQIKACNENGCDYYTRDFILIKDE
jgi:hypothetical protein